MLFAYSNIECPIWHFFHHKLQGRAAGHGRRNAHNLLILLCQFYYGITKNILVFGRLGNVKFLFEDFTCYLIEKSRCMPECLFLFCQGISLAFYGHNMKQFWTGDILQIF